MITAKKLSLKAILNTVLTSVVACILAISLTPLKNAFAQNFQVIEITDRICAISDPESSDFQLVVKSEKGLTVFGSFWSEITARKYKEEIAKALNRNDFSYTINTIDRLDMFGGNAAYEETRIIGHESFLDEFKGKEQEVAAEVQRLIEMWRRKEGYSRERMEQHEKGSEAAINEQKWMNTCRQRAEELENGFSLVLPTVFYDDSMTLNLGDITLKLIWFGKTGHYNGMTVAMIPEENTAIIPSFILHSQHLAPYPFGEYKVLDVPRWIAVLEEILEGENAVDRVICDTLWSRQRALTHLDYIRRLWSSVKNMDAAGKNIDEIQEQLSFEKDFAFVKEMQVYKDHGDDWLRPQHRMHVRLFFLQQKNLASEIIKEAGIDSLQVSLARVRKLRNDGKDIYFDETSINTMGYNLMNSGKLPEAIEIFKLNTEVFPESSNVYDSLGEAFMKNGDDENAIKNYKKSLELNPENKNAREMLDKLEKG